MSTLTITRTTYTRRTRYLVINDAPNDAEQKVDFHIQTGDYFATLATTIGLVEDALNDCIERGETPHSMHLMLLKRLREDLIYAHREYIITRKTTSFS